jgi:hypothetical protein
LEQPENLLLKREEAGTVVYVWQLTVILSKLSCNNFLFISDISFSRFSTR